MTNKEIFLQSYIEAALWSSIDENGTPLDQIETELADETLEEMKKDCDAFVDTHEETIENAVSKSNYGNFSQAGHDFWLTRCGYGCGFWDGDWEAPAATILCEASEKAGNVDLYVGDDGKIWMT